MAKTSARAPSGAPADDLEWLLGTLLNQACVQAQQAFNDHALDKVLHALTQEPSQPGEQASSHASEHPSTPASEHTHTPSLPEPASQGMGSAVSAAATSGSLRGPDLAEFILGHAPGGQGEPGSQAHAPSAPQAAPWLDMPSQARVPNTLPLPESAAQAALDVVPVELVGSTLSHALSHAAAAHAQLPMA